MNIIRTLIDLLWIFGKSILVLAVALGALLGLALWVAPGMPDAPGGAHASADSYYTCSMHPQVRQSTPGTCAFCGMNLIIATAAKAGEGLSLSEPARRIAGVQTTKLSRGAATLTIDAPGRIAADERSLKKVTATLAGRIEKLWIPFEGAEISENDPLVEYYVPEFPVLVEEYRAAVSLGTEVRDAFRERLRRFGLGDADIVALEAPGPVNPRFTIRAPRGGTIIERRVREGDYVKEGDVIAVVGSFATVVGELDIYEKDLRFVSRGTHVVIQADAAPGVALGGSIAYINNASAGATRTSGARVFMDNPGHVLRPGMWIKGTIEVPLDNLGNVKQPAESRPAESRPALYECPMHCEAPHNAPGNCNVCNMTLRSLQQGSGDPLLLPRSAILDLGRRRIAYVERDGRYVPRVVILGPRAGDSYILISGIDEGEAVVTRGAFLIDSQSQIEGRGSLFIDRPRDPAPGVVK